MQAVATEVNFDGILGPSYNHSATAPGGPGNLASQVNRGRPSNPMAAALDGLKKAKKLMQLGVKQGVLPPLVRPNLVRLFRLGLIKDHALLRADDLDALARHLSQHAAAAPHILAACFSGASVWTANWATVSPSADTMDKRVHFTPANQSRSFHRSLEGEEVCGVLKQIFADKDHFTIHDPLPGTYALGDEGAANHLRLAPQYGNKGINVFVYGRDGFSEPDPGRRHLARQTLEASRAVARLHGLDPFFTFFVAQNPTAVDDGIFHNDVIASTDRDLLFYHERAFVDSIRAVSDLSEAYHTLTGGHILRILQVPDKDISLEEAAVSYLFNSQIVRDRNGRRVLLSPRQCEFVPRVRSFLEALKQQGSSPFDEVTFVDIPASMRSGGGPACLRLRVTLTAEEENAISGKVLLSEDLLNELNSLVGKEYPTQVDEQNFVDKSFLKRCFDTTKRLYEILGLAPHGIP